jgi:hypothetical protein
VPDREIFGVAQQSRREARKDKIVPFHIRIVAGEACFVLRLVHRLAADEPAEPPTARGGVFFLRP